MKTTNYILELLIAGFGALLWLILLLTTLLCLSLMDVLCIIKELTSTQVIMLSPVVYVLGILIDHSVDRFYDHFFIPKHSEKGNDGQIKDDRRKERRRNFLSGIRRGLRPGVVFKHITSKEKYKMLRIKVYLSEQLKEEFVFRRTKIRLCRNWTVNGLFTTLFLLIIIIDGDYSGKQLVALRTLSLLIFLSAIISHYTWRDQVQKEDTFLGGFQRIEGYKVQRNKSASLSKKS